MRKNINKLATLVMTGALAASMSFGAFAAAPVYDGAVKFTKTLTKSDGDAPTPKATFTFSVVPGTAALADAKHPEIKAGVADALTFPDTGVSFTSADTTTTTTKSITKTIEGTFDTTKITEPGIYRYTVTEEQSDNPTIVNDTNATKTLDVYVVRNNDGVLEVSHSVLSNGTAVPEFNNNNEAEYTAKVAGFENSYTTYSLTLEKQVDGSMGEISRKFDFSIDLTNGPDSGKIPVTINGNAAEVTFTGGKASITGIKLSDDETFVITGLPSSTTYTITENLDVKEGYKVTTTGDAAAQLDGVTTTDPSVSGAFNDTDTYAATTGDEKVVFTNTKDAVTPTGVAMDIAPYALMVALAGGAAATFLRKKESFED